MLMVTWNREPSSTYLSDRDEFPFELSLFICIWAINDLHEDPVHVIHWDRLNKEEKLLIYRMFREKMYKLLNWNYHKTKNVTNVNFWSLERWKAGLNFELSYFKLQSLLHLFCLPSMREDLKIRLNDRRECEIKLTKSIFCNFFFLLCVNLALKEKTK